MRSLVLTMLAVLTATIATAQITLQAPDTIGAGSPFEVRWTGEGHERDFLSIVPVGTAEGLLPESSA